jgi:cytochrome c-type biogenesis protein CcmH/NrfF
MAIPGSAVVLSCNRLSVKIPKSHMRAPSLREFQTGVRCGQCGGESLGDCNKRIDMEFNWFKNVASKI